MDDFRVGSIPPADLFGQRRPSDGLGRRRQQRHGDEAADPEEASDTFDTLAAAGEEAVVDPDSIEDYYLPSDPAGHED